MRNLKLQTLNLKRTLIQKNCFINSFDSEESISLFPEKFLIDFSIIEKINKGSQATVYKVQNKKSLIYFAAKLYNTKDLEEIMMIEREINILKNIDHKGIIKMVDTFQDEKLGVYIILQEYFPSVCLQSFIKTSSLSNEELSNISQKISAAIVFLHENSIAHRDLTLNNVLINTTNMDIKIIDFGLSRNNINFNESYSPEGHMKFRPPPLEIFYNLFFADLWNMGLVFLSLALRKTVTTKMACSFIKNENEISDVENEIFINSILKNLRLIIKSDKKTDDAVRPSRTYFMNF